MISSTMLAPSVIPALYALLDTREMKGRKT